MGVSWMRCYILRACAAAAAALAVVIWPAFARAEVTMASTTTVVYGFGGRCPPTNWSNPRVRPSRAAFSLACENGIRHIHWQDWGTSSASGHGTVLIFNGVGFTPYPCTITLSTVRTHRGHRYFAHLVMKWTANGTNHKEVLNWKRDGKFWIWIGNYGGTRLTTQKPA